MTWDFSTESEFQEKLDWTDHFVRAECEPLDLAFPRLEHTPPHPALKAILDPLKDQVRAQGLWAAHLGPELGGSGFGQVKLALLNEVLGRARWAPVIFGTQAPDTGNAEILAHYGTAAQKARYLRPLLNGEVFSCYSMTEPHAGADPTMFTLSATLEDDRWILRGEKFFSSNARTAAFLIVMAVTDPAAQPHRRMSMFLVPTETAGIHFLRNVGTIGEPMGDGPHGYLRFEEVALPLDAMLGDQGCGFEVAQTRLGGGRIHHAMRTVAVCKMALDMMCQRAVTRETQGTRLADKQLVQEAIADSWIELQQFRLLVLHTAWLIDSSSTASTRREIAACKVQAARLMHDIVHRALHIHGALGASNETPLAAMWERVPMMGIMDGPTEVHQVTVARQTVRDYSPYEGIFPPYWLPPRVDAAKARYADVLAAMSADTTRSSVST